MLRGEAGYFRIAHGEMDGDDTVNATLLYSDEYEVGLPGALTLVIHDDEE